MSWRKAEHLESWRRHLIEEWPELSGAIAHGCFDDCFDFSPSAGWRQLVIDTVRKLYGISPDFEIGQVKSKFGQLRIYGRGNDEQSKLMRQAEQTSATMCEYCGAPGSVRHTSDSWIVTACEQCARTEELVS